MPKTRLRHPTELDGHSSRLEAAQKFASGDRVTHRLTGKVGKFISINRGFAVIDVWVEFETDSERSVPISCNPLDLELVQQCQEYTQSSVASAESQACATEPLSQPDLNINLELPNLSKQIPTVEPYSKDTSQLSHATMTSEHTARSMDNSMLWSEAAPAKELAQPTRMEKGLTTIAQDCGGKCGELSMNADPSLSCGKTLQPPDIPSQDSSLALSPSLSGVLPASGMYASQLPPPTA